MCFLKIIGVRVGLWFTSLIINLDSVTWDEKIVEGLNFMADHVLQVPLFLMTLMRYITPTLDNLYAELCPVSTVKNVAKLKQLYGIIKMGRHDLRTETQAR